MSIINLNQIAHDYGNKLLFENINLTLDSQTKAGLIGRNGTGKSTLFKIITGQIAPYRGSIAVAKGYKIGFFAQDYSFSSKDKLWDWLYSSKTELINKRNELKALEIELANSHNEKLLKKFDDLQTEYELLGGFNYENEIKQLLLTFGFTEKDHLRIIDDFSGGEKTRIRLISILLNKFNFILFDEPTNHLDLVTVDWFIQYLKSLDCGYLIVSHDRYLLDQTVNKIYELRNQKIDVYSGNYSMYEQQAKEREILLQKQYSQQQRLIEKTEDFIRRNMAGQKTNLAKSRLKMLNRMDKIELDSKAKDIKININTTQRSGNDIFRLQNLIVGYHPSFVLAKDINLNLHYKDKICLVGSNGSGKSTLLKILNNELEPLQGELWTGYNLSVGYFDQLHIDLDNDLTVLETIWNLAPGESYGYVMTYLAKFGFYEDKVEQKVASLSGGEKSRLYLAELIHEKPNLLILDEPTNHLDISMIQSLEQALKNYDGTLILVSHDRYFIQAITDDYWIIKDETIRHYKESFESIMERIRPFTKEKKIKIKTPKTESNENKPKKLNEYHLNKMLEQIASYEEMIKEKENEMAQLQSKFSDSDFYTNKENIDKTNKQMQVLRDEINQVRERKDKLETEYLEHIHE